MSQTLTIASNTSRLYEPLAEGYIRLLTILSHDSINLIFRLDTYPQGQAPEYDAVSYCWGDDRTEVNITCNGFSLSIRKNLRLALTYFTGRPPPYRPLWIDAICLNQNDSDEKAIQVPLMGNIYTCATRTVVWLGEADEGTDIVLDFIPFASSHLAAGRDADDLLEKQYDKHWDALQAFLQRPWFKRLWILQETLLSPDIIMLCGNRSIEWSRLHSFIHQDVDSGLQGALFNTKTLQGIDYVTQGVPRMLIMEIARSNIIAGRHLSLSKLLYNFEGRGCAEPVDRIWALLGMMEPGLAANIQQAGIIDYSNAGKHHYWRSYLAVMGLLYEFNARAFEEVVFEGVGLAKPGDSQLPSWCPDFNMHRLHGTFRKDKSHRAGFIDADDKRALEFSLDAQDHSLSISGFVVDTVVLTTSTAESLEIPYTSWFRHSADIAHAVLGTSDEAIVAFYETVCAIGTNISFVRNTKPDDWLTIHRNLYAQLDRWSDPFRIPEYSDDLGLDDLLHDFGFQAIAACGGRRFFGTTHGRIGLGPPEIQVGDKICVFTGALSLYVTREVSGEPQSATRGDRDGQQGDQRSSTGRYELVGDAYVHGLMFGEAFAAESREETRRIVLV